MSISYQLSIFSGQPTPHPLDSRLRGNDGAALWSIKEKGGKRNKILSDVWLLDSDALGEITGKIDGAAALSGSKISQKLDDSCVYHG
jgi:hypothetical protein